MVNRHYINLVRLSAATSCVIKRYKACSVKGSHIIIVPSAEIVALKTVMDCDGASQSVLYVTSEGILLYDVGAGAVPRLKFAQGRCNTFSGPVGY